jgi:glycosyltransferase involved in cell wall biosynthesis
MANREAIVNFIRKYASGLYTLSRIIKAKRWPQKSIVFYIGKAQNGLGPKSLEKGASGSHTAVIYLTREWAKLGYNVTIYSNCGGDEGVHEGVNFINYYHFNWNDRFDTLIIWRHPYMLDLKVKANKVFWDWHDLLAPERCFPIEKIKRFDQIFSKSSFQRKLLSQIPDDKFSVISNGIDSGIAELYNQEKEPYRLVYASRYYRGLELMLRYGWPIIKRELPDAELHLYYGFNKVEMRASRDAWRETMHQLMAQPGVKDHGRVGQDVLIRDKARSAIHYYGCSFEEIDCISVRESAVVGCLPVTTDFAALSEKEYCHKVPGHPGNPETQEALAYRIIELLKDPEQLQDLRARSAEVARQDTWTNIAKRWVESWEAL